MMPETPPPPPRRRKGGRPKGDPSAVRASTIGVRVSPSEYAALKDKAVQMGVTPAQWLRQAALSRRLVAYDQPVHDDFAGVLNVFAAPASDPVDVLLPRSLTANEADAAALVFRLKSLQWDSAGHRLQAEISPAPEASMKLELVVGGLRFSMQPLQGAAGAWVCDLPGALASATVFASVEIFRGAERWMTLPRWVNDVAALEHASHAARLLEPFKGLERNATSTEQRQMLDELQEVAHALFNDAAAFRDPGFGSASSKESKDDTPTAPVNPADLIVHLEGHHEGLPNLGSAAPVASLSLTGILRLLFDGESEQSAGSVATKDEEIDEGQLPDDAEVAPKKLTERTAATSNPVPIEDRFRDRLAAQISTFLTEMSSVAFAERCSATQMVQAVRISVIVDACFSLIVDGVSA
jgi:hypothetical protein